MPMDCIPMLFCMLGIPKFIRFGLPPMDGIELPIPGSPESPGMPSNELFGSIGL